MVSPSAVEDNERDEKLKSHTDIIRDIMDVINGLDESYSPEIKKEILNYLIQSMLQDNGLNDILQNDTQNENDSNTINDNINNENDIITDINNTEPNEEI